MRRYIDPDEEDANFGIYEERLVAYCDVLGFGHSIALSNDEPQEFVKCYDTVSSIVRVSEFIAEFGEQTPELDLDFRVTTFSDNVVVSCRPSLEALVLLLNLIEIYTDKANMPIRGAITMGSLLHTKSVVFGPALVRAHHVESKIAKYPRVLIDGPVKAKMLSKAHLNPSIDRFFGILICKDFDGRLMVNYLRTCKQPMSEPIYPTGVILTKSVRAKYKWLARAIDRALLASKDKPYLREEALVPGWGWGKQNQQEQVIRFSSLYREFR